MNKEPVYPKQDPEYDTWRKTYFLKKVKNGFCTFGNNL
jgi:hypothetical protein